MTPHASKFNNPIELPSIEEVETWDKQRQEAIDSLEIFADGSKVKCQNCRISVPIVGKLPRPKKLTG